MLKVKSILVVMLFLLIGTTYSCSLNCVKGEGDLVRKTLDMSSFSKVSVESAVDVVLGYGNTQKVEIEGQSNIIDLISLRVKDGEWAVFFKESVCFNKSVTVFVTLPRIDAVSINGSGDIKCESMFDQDSFDISVNGAGDVQFEMNANTISIDINGSGDVSMEGKAEDLAISINGSGSVNAFDLKSQKAVVSVNGSGDTEINVEQSLNASINGSGDVSYQGAPTDLQVNDLGSGEVSKD